MKLYLISQNQNQNLDTFDSAVVCAVCMTDASRINPRTGNLMTEDEWKTNDYWCRSADYVDVKCIGNAAKEVKYGLVLSSFNAG